jgi:hypothetical protein
LKNVACTFYLNVRLKESKELIFYDASDAAFVSVTHSIGGWDTVEEYVACRVSLYQPVLAWERLKMGRCQYPNALPEFLLPDCRRRLMTVSERGLSWLQKMLWGSYACGEHDACVAVVLLTFAASLNSSITRMSCGPDAGHRRFQKKA